MVSLEEIRDDVVQGKAPQGSAPDATSAVDKAKELLGIKKFLST